MKLVEQENYVTVPTTEKGVLKPAITKAMKDKLLDDIKNAYEFEVNFNNHLVTQVGVDTEGNPVYFRLEGAITRKRDIKGKSEKSKKVELTGFLQD